MEMEKDWNKSYKTHHLAKSYIIRGECNARGSSECYKCASVSLHSYTIRDCQCVRPERSFLRSAKINRSLVLALVRRAPLSSLCGCVGYLHAVQLMRLDVYGNVYIITVRCQQPMVFRRSGSSDSTRLAAAFTFSAYHCHMCAHI